VKCRKRRFRTRASWRGFFAAELRLLHVVNPPGGVAAYGAPTGVAVHVDQHEMVADDEHRALGELDAFTIPSADEIPSIVREVRLGVPFEAIIHYAIGHEVDLIVMGTHGRRGLSHALLGSVAEKVVRNAPCPVLTVRPKD
jgi:universal stress protein A